MNFISLIKYKKIGNKKYAYNVTSYYNKVKKRHIYKSRYTSKISDLDKGTITTLGMIKWQGRIWSLTLAMHFSY